MVLVTQFLALFACAPAACAPRASPSKSHQSHLSHRQGKNRPRSFDPPQGGRLHRFRADHQRIATSVARGGRMGGSGRVVHVLRRPDRQARLATTNEVWQRSRMTASAEANTARPPAARKRATMSDL